MVQSKNSRLDLDDVELMADPEAALEVDPDILDEIARRKTAGAEEAVQVLNQEETENEYSAQNCRSEGYRLGK